MTTKEILTAALLGIVFGIIFGIGFDHLANSCIDQAAIESALAL